MTDIQASPDPSGVFFWARSGKGHETAKEGIKQQKIKEYAAQGKKLDTQADIDITGEKVISSVKLPFVGGLGDIGVNKWNEAQKKGDLKFLENYASWGWIGEIIFYPLVYFRVKWLLQDLKVEPEFVVSTQAFCLNAIMSAMRTVNKERSWKMHMHVYLTDMPSKKAIHFFPSIRKVAASKDLRQMLTLHAPPPLLKTGETEEQFWKKYCGKVKVITKEKFPIREAFLETGELKKRLEQPEVRVKIRLNHAKETDIIKNGLGKEALKASQFDGKAAELAIKHDDKLAFLMLGSQPTSKSVLNWLNSFVQEGAKATAEKDKQHYFFLYCGAPHNQKEQNPLLNAVSEEIERLRKEDKLPPNLHVVPFTNQDPDEIALLMARSDVSITRSGGATAMELFTLHEADLPKRKDKLVLIHSEAMLAREDSPLQLNHEEFAKKITGEISKQITAKRLLSSPEWQAVKREMMLYCKQMGCSKKTSRALVENILNLYLYDDSKKELPQVDQIFKVMEEHAKALSQEAKPERKRIEEQMKKMQNKEKYKDFDLRALRQLAIERVLTKEGIVLWEAGNAKYLAQKMGAHVTNPHYAKSLLAKSFF